MYVTAGGLPGDFAADAGGPSGALDRADAFCKEQADLQTSSADVQGRRWRAWLCAGGSVPLARVGGFDAQWIRPDGAIVFSTQDALNMRVASTSISANRYVWTGCDSYGNVAHDTCGDWTDAGAQGVTGDDRSDGGTSWNGVGPSPCVSPRPIHCFEQR